MIARVAVLATLLLQGCSDRWESFVYPNRNDLTVHINGGQWSTLEDCRNASLLGLRVAGRLEIGTYECGLNCKPFTEDMKMCEKTTR